jgi:hypothetical protein
MSWILFVCVGVSGWGCGAIREEAYPNEASCYRALSAMKTGDQPMAESNIKRNTVAYCKPDAKVKS